VTRTGERTGEKLIAQNRRARHDYFIESSYEAGLALTGTEVKSCRAGKVTLSDAYASVSDGEAWLHQLHIAPYSHGNRFNHEPMRPRKLLLHKAEIERMQASVSQEGRTLVPLRVYFKSGLVKVELAVARGKKSYDKRATIAARDAERRMRQELGRRR
jgi:SsrA-binding protein